MFPWLHYHVEECSYKNYNCYFFLIASNKYGMKRAILSEGDHSQELLPEYRTAGMKLKQVLLWPYYVTALLLAHMQMGYNIHAGGYFVCKVQDPWRSKESLWTLPLLHVGV